MAGTKFHNQGDFPTCSSEHGMIGLFSGNFLQNQGELAAQCREVDFQLYFYQISVQYLWSNTVLPVVFEYLCYAA